MRVLYVNPTGGLGGSERSLFDLLVSLERSRLHVKKKVVLLADGELARRIRELGIEVEVQPLPEALAMLGEYARGDSRPRRHTLWRGAFSALSHTLAFRRSVQAFRPDIVHTNGMKAHLLAALAVPDVPRIVHLRDFISERRFSRRALPLLGRRALFVTNSEAVGRDALGMNGRLRVRVVHNAIDLEEFRPRPRNLVQLAALAGLDAPPVDAVVVGLVATYAWWKGHRTFLEAAARVRAALPAQALRFYVVGGPVYRTAGSEVTAAELRAELERVNLIADAGLVPFQNDIGSLYCGLDVMVHASERPEPFGRTIVEAMASGCAVVVARGGGAVELFTEGRTGLGFRPGDPDDLARAVIELVRNRELRVRMSREARAEAEARFGRERLAGEIFGAYEELLGRR